MISQFINDFTISQFISKWIRRQKYRQKWKTMGQKDVKVEEEIIYKSVFIYLNT